MKYFMDNIENIEYYKDWGVTFEADGCNCLMEKSAFEQKYKIKLDWDEILKELNREKTKQIITK